MKVTFNEEYINQLTISENEIGYLIFLDPKIECNISVERDNEDIDQETTLYIKLDPNISEIVLIPENEEEDYAFKFFSVAYELLENGINIYLISDLITEYDNRSIIFDFVNSD